MTPSFSIGEFSYTRATKFITSLKTSLTVGRYFLCHVGIRPGLPFKCQSETLLFAVIALLRLVAQQFEVFLHHLGDKGIK